jgi:predicted nucleic acid-binding protein
MLSRAIEDGSLLICPVAFAECSLEFASAAEATTKFESLGIFYDAFSRECAYLAGQVFLRYRREGGPREHLIPDFLIASHASTQADRLAAIDRDYLRASFPELRMLALTP